MEHVFVRENLSCDEMVEIPYYSCEKFEDIFTHCACEPTDRIDGGYSICQYCQRSEKMPALKRKRKLFSPPVLDYCLHINVNCYVFGNHFLPVLLECISLCCICTLVLMW